MVARFEKFSYFISEISKNWHKIASDEMIKHGLKGPYAVYFTALSRYDEGITAARLAEICARDKADVSRAVNQMAKKGLVIKKEVNQNHYNALLILTNEGRDVASKIKEKATYAVKIGGKGLTDEQRNDFYNSLELICNNLQSLSKEGL